MRLLATLVLTAAAFGQELDVLDQNIFLRIDPDDGSFQCTLIANLRNPKGGLAGPPKGMLHKGVKVDRWLVADPQDGRITLKASWGGRITDPVKKSGAATWVAGDSSDGTISKRGSYMPRGFYLPSRTPFLARIQIKVTGGHKAVSVGKLTHEDDTTVVYETGYPIDGLVVVTGPWVVDEQVIDGVTCRTYLLEKDRGNKDILLASLEAEIPRFQKLFGKVPDQRFDVVENFFATGYGFSNFTLLGDTVIRYVCAKARRSGQKTLPAGYLDHELVHCWLGNYLHVDYEKGNWCEALTSYFSNYRAAVRNGTGVAHRKKVSRSFSLRVGPKNDYPIVEFKAKSHAYENDIGYGKGSMVFHMLARRLGKERFEKAVRHVIETRGGTALGWEDLVAGLSEGAEEPLKKWFEPWLTRTGGPILRFGEVRVEGTRVAGTILQNQSGAAYDLDVPLRIETRDGVEEQVVHLAAKEVAFALELKSKPVLVELDPGHDVFRIIPRERVAPCMEAVLTAPKRVGFGNAALLKRLKVPAADPGLPKDAAVLAIGLPDAIRDEVLLGARRQDSSLLVEAGRFRFRGETYDQPGDAILFSYARHDAPGRPVTFFHGNAEAAYARVNYLPYYSSHGWMVFRAGRPVARGNFIGDRTTRAEITKARAGRPEPIVADLLWLTAPVHAGRRAGSVPAYKLANQLRGRLHATGLKVHAWPSVDFPRWNCSKTRTLVLLDGDEKTTIEDAFLPLHKSASPARPVAFHRIVGAGAKGAEVKGALVLLQEGDEPETPPEELGAAAVGIIASDTKMTALGPRAVWNNLVVPSILERWTKRGTPDLPRAVAGLISRSKTVPPSRIPYLYLRPSTAKALAAHPKGKGGVITFRLSRSVWSTANIIGVFGEAKQPGVLLSAHWDGIGKLGDQVAEGAADNAAGVAIVLRVAARLRKDHEAGRLERPVVVALFGAEEFGLWGSRQFARAIESPECPVAKPRFAVNVDGIGSGGATVYLIGRSKHPKLAESFARALEGSKLKLGRDIDKYAHAHGSDHWPLFKAGVPAVSVFSADYRAMNSLRDNRAHVDIGVLRETVAVVYRMVKELATRK